MKLRILTVGWLFSSAFALALPATAQAQTVCTNDTDCTANGTACGTDVCDWNLSKTCVSATSAGVTDWCGGDYGSGESQSAEDAQCKCHGEGATCHNYHCSFFVPQDAGGGTTPDASSPPADAGHASSSSTTSSSSTSSTSSAASSSKASGSTGSSGNVSSAETSTTASTAATASTSSQGSGGSSAEETSHGGESESENSSEANGGGSSSSGGCKVSAGFAGAPWECGALFATAMVVARRRRRR